MSVAKKKFSKSIAILLVVATCVLAVAALVACNPTHNKVTFVYWQFEDGTRTTITQNIENNRVQKPADPDDDGEYTFDYWTLEGQDTPFDFDSEVTKSITLVAKFSKKSTQITVTYVYDNGDDDLVRNAVGGRVVQIKNPDKEGSTFVCWTLEGEDTPFDFNTVITESIVLVAKWSSAAQSTAKLYWDNADGSVSFVFDGATPNSANVGDTVSFRLNVSPYYKGTPSVLAGTSPVSCDENGVYSFVVKEEVTVYVTGLVRDNTAIQGRGTAYDPYIITTPAQLKAVTDGVNNRNNTIYNTAYIKLGNDIDLQGETIDPIGVDLYYDMMFCGDFDGDGHTIKNFVISDNYAVAGLFGYINTAYIANLNVATDINAEVPVSGLFVGGIAAYNFASDIVGCSYNGTINVANGVSGSSVSILVGGIVGFMQGTGSSPSDAYTASVSYCAVNADMHVTGSNEVTSIGGVAGAMVGLSSLATANVYNCSSNVTIDGFASNAGGVVGWMRQLSSVDNCYATGAVSTRGVANEIVKGGIVGDAYNENSVTYCLSAVKISGVTNASADNYGIIGQKREAKFINVDDRETVTIGNRYTATGEVTVGNKTYNTETLSDVAELMDWSTAEWQEKDGAIVPKAEGNKSVAMNVNFKFGSEYNGHLEATLAQIATNESDIYGYIPISYVFEGDGLNTLTAADGKISYGFFLDEELTQRISASFLLTGHATTVYVAFADYSPMAGEYYAVVGNINAKLTFDDNGRMTMYTEGKRAYYMYVFDGEKAVIHDSYFLYLYYDYLGRTPSGNAYMDVYAEFTAGGLKIYDGVMFGDGAYFPAITANRNNAILGEWYTSGQTTTYTFNADGTGTVSNGNQFTYAINVKTVTIRFGNRNISARLSDDGRTMQTSDGVTLSITKYDDFNGTWESDFNDRVTVTFDGVNTAKIGNKTYNYNIEDGVLVSEGLSAYFNDDMLLVMEYDGKTMVLGREGSCIGTWQDTGLGYQFILLGINKDGFGVGYDTYGYDFTYTYKEGTLSMYHRTSLYGFGDIYYPEDNDRGDALLYMAMFTPASGTMVDDYNMTFVDIFEGTWHADNGTTLVFNGNGAYDIYVETSDDMVWDVRGSVTVTKNGESSIVRYYYDRATATATFRYNDKDCVAHLSENGIFVKFGDDTVEFTEPDALSVHDWYTAAIDRIFFDGRGNAGGGTVTFTVGGTQTEYEYAYNADNSAVDITKDGDTIYTLNIATMTLSDKNGDEIGTLGAYCDILGKVYTVKGNDGSFELNCAELLDAQGRAHGKWSNSNVIFSYVSENTLAVYDAYMSTVMFYLVYVDENTVIIATVSSNGTLAPYSVAFIPDELMGVYFNSDKSVKLDIDGASKNSYMFSAAVFCDIDEDGEQISDEESYTYFVKDGVWGIYSYEKNDDEFEYTLVYTISLQEVAGATKFTTADGSKTIWIKEA